MKSRDYVDMSNYVTNGEWSYVGTHIVRNEVQYPIGPAVYPDVSVYVTMRRRILYYMLNIILDSFNVFSIIYQLYDQVAWMDLILPSSPCLISVGLAL